MSGSSATWRTYTLLCGLPSLLFLCSLFLFAKISLCFFCKSPLSSSALCPLHASVRERATELEYKKKVHKLHCGAESTKEGVWASRACAQKLLTHVGMQ